MKILKINFIIFIELIYLFNLLSVVFNIIGIKSIFHKTLNPGYRH